MTPTCCTLDNRISVSQTARSLCLTLSIVALAALCCFPLLFHLGERELASSHEARAAQNAQSMLSSGRWDLPRLFDGRIELQKPPMYYWMVAIFGWLNASQVDAWCVRLPSALAALGCVLTLTSWSIRHGRPFAGLLAAAILATSLHFTTLARTGRIDMPLTFAVTLTVFGFYEGCMQRRLFGRSGTGWFLLAYLASAIGVMLKGPIAVVLPAAVCVAQFIFCGRRPGWSFLIGGKPKWIILSGGRKSPELDTGADVADSGGLRPPIGLTNPLGLSTLWWGVPLVLVLTLPWFAWANIQTDGEFFRVFFWRHNIDRGIGTDETLRALPWWYYGPELARGLLPWSLLLPFAVYWLWRNPDRDARFGAVWLLAVTAMLSCVRFKRADYLLPAFPGAALILGCVFERWHQAKASRRLPVVFGSVVVLTTALWLGYISWIVPAQELARTHRAFAAEVRKHAPGHVVFFRTEAHVIGFHAGPPLDSVLEWENLDIWSGMPQTTYVVMPRQCWDEWQANLTRGTLEAVTFSDQMEVPACRWPEWFQRFTDFGRENRERPYVLARTKSLDAKR